MTVGIPQIGSWPSHKGGNFIPDVVSLVLAATTANILHANASFCQQVRYTATSTRHSDCDRVTQPLPMLLAYSITGCDRHSC